MENDKTDFKKKFKVRCFRFSIDIIRLCDNLKKTNSWSIIDQLIRSATSIGANIVEGGNSCSKKEFINYFQVALKFSSETLYWLSILKEINQKEIKEIDKLIKECLEIKKIISTIIINTRSNSKF